MTLTCRPFFLLCSPTAPGPVAGEPGEPETGSAADAGTAGDSVLPHAAAPAAGKGPFS